MPRWFLYSLLETQALFFLEKKPWNQYGLLTHKLLYNDYDPITVIRGPKVEKVPGSWRPPFGETWPSLMCHVSSIPPGSELSPWKMMVGRLLSYWEGNFPGAMLNLREDYLLNGNVNKTRRSCLEEDESSPSWTSSNISKTSTNSIPKKPKAKNEEYIRSTIKITQIKKELSAIQQTSKAQKKI